MAFKAVVASVTNGAVTLTGTVDNLKAKRAAEADVRNVVGVWRVVNNIMTKPQSVAAEALEANVEWALFTDPVVKQDHINTTVNNGKVTLEGTVNTYFEKAYAEDVVTDLAGVTAVDNNLKVKNPRSYLFWKDIDPSVTLLPLESDGEIKKAYRARFGGRPSWTTKK
ncbi:MAG: BON domain-containing protein [Cytophagales bacterium]|nr:BON domain-containing protein [Cytophagales bacterium]